MSHSGVAKYLAGVGGGYFLFVHNQGLLKQYLFVCIFSLPDNKLI